MNRSRNIWIATAVVLVLAAAVVIGLQRTGGPQPVAVPSGSPSPSAIGSPSKAPGTSTASATSSACVASCPATASPAAAVSGIYNDDFGFIVFDGGATATVRKESSNARITAFAFAGTGAAVSADGRYVAYWTESTSSQPSQLRMFTTLGNATSPTLVTLAAGQRGGGIAWASDGASLLYSTETGSFGIGGGTNSATLNVYEAAAAGRHGTTIDTQTNTGWLYRPIAWDRSANLAAAGLTGEGAGLAFYVTVQINPDNTFTRQQVDTKSRTTFGIPMGSVRASSDAKLVLGVDADSGDIRWWPLADYAANRSQAGAGKNGALWRPGTHEIGSVNADQLVLYDADKGAATGGFGGVAAGSVLRMFRADGSAVLFAAPGTGAGQTSYTLVLLAKINPSPGDRVTFQELSGLLTSVRFR